VSALLGDLAYAGRLLRKAPGSALVIILTLAVALGATTAMFSVVDGVLLKRLPVKDQDRLLVVWTSIPERGFQHWALSYTSYLGLRERLRTVSGVAAHPYSGAMGALLHLDGNTAIRVQQLAVTGEWFDVLGVRPRAGRLLTPADDHSGSPPAVVLSSGLAERFFGTVDNAVGQRVRIYDVTFTVVGVTPADFEYPRTAQAWVPSVRVRDSPYVAWDLVARVAPGFTKQQTISDLTLALAALPPEGGSLGGIAKNQVIHAESFADNVVGTVRAPLLMLGAGVLLMLTVAGVNVAHLLIARSIVRRQELSVRAAVGATRFQLVRLVATDAVLLTAIAAFLGAFVALAALKAILALAPAELPRLAEVGIDRRALSFAIATAMLVAITITTLPALRTASVEAAESLRTRERGNSRGSRGHWLKHALLVGQIAITTIVLSTAALMLSSLERMRRLDVGLAAQDVLLGELDLPSFRRSEPAAIQQEMVRIAEHAATLPGVRHASAVATAPFAGTQGVDATVFAEGQTTVDTANPIVNYEGVDASYFDTIGLPILRGRGIDRRDREGSQPVVVINETFARTFWPGADPIGRRIKWGSAQSDSPWLTVVGLVADARYRDLAVVRPSVYVPYAHGIPVTPGYIAVRAENPGAAEALRRAVSDLAPGATVVRIDPLPQLLAAPLARPQFQTTLASLFATLALLLSVIGIYGVLSFAIQQRRREIGIRIALGATSSRVRRLVLSQAIAIGVLGVMSGVGGALAVNRLVEPLLFGVTATEPLVLSGAAVGCFLAVLSAALLPTRTATRTDPLLVLRSE